MKLGKKLLVLALAVVAALSLVACGGSKDEAGVKVYTIEAKFNSDTVNQWKNFYLVDEDTYILTVDAVDSKDATKVTCDFVMKGNYTLDGDKLTIEMGYGSVYALNGDTPITMQINPEAGAAMYAAMMGTEGLTYTLLEDGSFEVAQ